MVTCQGSAHAKCLEGSCCRRGACALEHMHEVWLACQLPYVAAFPQATMCAKWHASATRGALKPPRHHRRKDQHTVNVQLRWPPSPQLKLDRIRSSSTQESTREAKGPTAVSCHLVETDNVQAMTPKLSIAHLMRIACNCRGSYDHRNFAFSRSCAPSVHGQSFFIDPCTPSSHRQHGAHWLCCLVLCISPQHQPTGSAGPCPTSPPLRMETLQFMAACPPLA